MTEYSQNVHVAYKRRRGKLLYDRQVIFGGPFHNHLFVCQFMIKVELVNNTFCTKSSRKDCIMRKLSIIAYRVDVRQRSRGDFRPEY